MMKKFLMRCGCVDTVETFLCELRSVCVACFSLVAGFLGASVVDLAGLPVPIL